LENFCGKVQHHPSTHTLSITYRHRRILHAVSALLLWPTDGRAAENDYFTNPPGCEWGSLLFTNAAAYCVSATPSGYVIAGQCEGPPGESGQTAVVLALSLEGYPGHGYFFPGVESGGGHRPSGAFSIVPSYGAGGEWDGYLVTGYRVLHFEEDGRQWANPALWVAKLDLGFYTVWERTGEGPHGVGRWGNAVIWDPAGFYERAGCLISGAQTFDLGLTGAEFHRVRSTQGLVTRLYSDGDLHWEIVARDSGREWMGAEVYSVASLQWGGYLFGTSRGICMTSSGLVLQWTVQETNCFYSVKPTADGGCIGVGTQCEPERDLGPQGEITWTDIVLTKVDASGNVEWSRTFGRRRMNDRGHDVTTASGGDFVLVGDAEKTLSESPTDAIIVRVSSSGDVRWDVRLGGSQDAAAYSVVAMPGNCFLVAGEAVGKMWLFKLRGNLTVPVPQFTYSPASPVFVGQEITFDASASSAPGGSIIDYSWDFGDGQTASGPVVRHTYHSPTNYPVCLTVTSSDGVVRSVTQIVEIIHLAVQWERFLSRFEGDRLQAMTEAWDGGFVLTGETRRYDLWLLKTDSRGRPVWERSYQDSTCPGYAEAGYSVARAFASGYVVAGERYCRATRDDGWLLKVNEAGDLEWEKAYLVTGDNSDVFRCVAPLPDGGYILSGSTWEHVYGDPRWPWLVRIDPEGNELENWKLPVTPRKYYAQWVVPLPDGYVVACGGEGYSPLTSILVAKVRTDQSVEWINSLPDSPSYGSRGWWVTATGDGGFVTAGTAYMDFGTLEFGTRSCLVKLSSTGNRLWTNFWPKASTRARTYGRGAAVIPNKGFVVVGAYEDLINPSLDSDLLLHMTDPEGQTQWARMMGATNRFESGLAVLALPGDALLVLGQASSSPGSYGAPWLFKLAPNRPPVARIHASTNGAPVGETLTFDGSASTDRDGTVALHEWDFGDGQTATGAIVSHSYTNSGTYVVRLTAVDDREAEGIAIHTNYVAGAAVIGPDVELESFSITNCPSCDQAIYSFEDAPELVDWTRALGATVQLGVVTTQGPHAIQITFPDPIPAGAKLYSLWPVSFPPGVRWSEKYYTVISAHTIHLVGQFATGYELVLVLAPTAPLPAFTGVQTATTSRLAMTFSTTPGFRYRMQRAPELRSGAWTDVPHALSESEPCTIESVTGTGATVTAFLDVPTRGNAFFRLTMESTVP
jgi:PKD repeat protein